jgi:hypothetical protein
VQAAQHADDGAARGAQRQRCGRAVQDGAPGIRRAAELPARHPLPGLAQDRLGIGRRMTSRIRLITSSTGTDRPASRAAS